MCQIILDILLQLYFPDAWYDLPHTEFQQEISATGRVVTEAGLDANLTEITVHTHLISENITAG